MQRFLEYACSRVSSTRAGEPSIASWEIQLAIEEICPRLRTSKLILLSIARALMPSRYCHEMTQSIAEHAAKVTGQISKLVEKAEQPSQLRLLGDIAQLDQILGKIQIFVQSESQRTFPFGQDLSAQYTFLLTRLTAILESFEQAISRHGLPGPLDDRVTFTTNSSTTCQESMARHDLLHQTQFSALSGAHHFVSNGATYNNILGNYVVMAQANDEYPPSQGGAPKGIVKGLRALSVEDVSLERQIYKGHGYRLYSALNKKSGEIVAMKVYEGSRSKERCLEAAKFMTNRKVIHPNVLHMIAVCPHKSEISFLIFAGEYEDTVDHMLGQVLKKDLQQSLVLGLQTVIGLSSGLDYLQDLDYPFTSVDLDHFSILSCKGKIVISFEAEDLCQMTELDEQLNPSNNAHGALQVFHGLCQRTFDAACKNHYECQEIQRAFVDEFDDDSMEGIDSSDASRSSDTHAPDGLDSAGHSANLASSTPTPKKSPRERSSRRTLPSGHRQELVWKPPTSETGSLDDISRQFQYFLKSHSSSSEPVMVHRRGRYTARTSHRCPGYNRVEITLTTDIERSAIITHSSPTPHEICLVCKEVVKDAEIFNCICGGNDDESRPTIRCTKCSEWHHWPCVEAFIFDRHKFVCKRCQNPGKPAEHPPLAAASDNPQPSSPVESSSGQPGQDTTSFNSLTSENLSRLARTKLQLPDSSRDAASIRRWVLLKNSLLRSPSQPSTTIQTGSNSYANDNGNDAGNAEEAPDVDEDDAFVFPDVSQLLGVPTASKAVSHEAQWLDSLLEDLEDEPEDNYFPGKRSAHSENTTSALSPSIFDKDWSCFWCGKQMNCDQAPFFPYCSAQCRSEETSPRASTSATEAWFYPAHLPPGAPPLLVDFTRRMAETE